MEDLSIAARGVRVSSSLDQRVEMRRAQLERLGDDAPSPRRHLAPIKEWFTHPLRTAHLAPRHRPHAA
ncbi:hypothetical protein [Demequina phytophila]|uniref:hypothetical protein n=1 Tax=Demequina phytophila TaxID=1638981 RepID=UPI000782527E|nr:hypothetical protein [Demequina phytophila]